MVIKNVKIVKNDQIINNGYKKISETADEQKLVKLQFITPQLQMHH